MHFPLLIAMTSLFDAGSEADDIVVLPHFDEMGFTGVNRTRKTHIEPSNAGLVVARHRLQYAVASMP